jgi:hypothetical protein
MTRVLLSNIHFWSLGRQLSGCKGSRGCYAICKDEGECRESEKLRGDSSKRDPQLALGNTAQVGQSASVF